MTDELEQPNEWDLAQERGARMRSTAEAIYADDTAYVRAKLEIAQEAFNAIEGKAWERLQEVVSATKRMEEEAWVTMWNAHLDREREHNRFIVDLLSNPDPEVMRAKLRAARAEDV
jgi:ribosomal protein L11 methylase PrmA